MKPVILTAFGIVLLFASGLLAVETKRRWWAIGGFGALALVCLYFAKGQPWLLAMGLLVGLLAYAMARRETDRRKEGGKEGG